MGRPCGTKNNMRTPEEKEKIVLEYLNSNVGYRVITRNYNINPGLFSIWISKYRDKGINGLKSSVGKHSNTQNCGKYKRNKTEVENLKDKLLKKEIEIMRLKKGYVVKGVGAKKEYVSISDVNMK